MKNKAEIAVRWAVWLITLVLLLIMGNLLAPMFGQTAYDFTSAAGLGIALMALIEVERGKQ